MGRILFNCSGSRGATEAPPSIDAFMRRTLLAILTLLLLLTPCGCATSIPNAMFPAEGEIVDAEEARMRETRVQLERPVLILAGYRSTMRQPARVAERLRLMTSGRRGDFLPVSYFWVTDIDEATRRAIEAVEERWPSDDPDWTTEVDVVAISMGGLVARLGATEQFGAAAPGRKRLRINRLFTMATPHRGAILADLIALDSAAKDMRSDSRFLLGLDEALRDASYEIIPYARTRDTTVGASRTAPPDCEPIWVDGPALFSHATIALDGRILIDIARRLRGEWPLAFRGSAPPMD